MSKPLKPGTLVKVDGYEFLGMILRAPLEGVGYRNQATYRYNSRHVQDYGRRRYPRAGKSIMYDILLDDDNITEVYRHDFKVVRTRK